MIKNLETALKNSGWQYEIGDKANEFAIFTLFRTEPSRRGLIGFFVPSEEVFVFAVAEMLRADAASVETETPAAETTSFPAAGAFATTLIELLKVPTVSTGVAAGTITLESNCTVKSYASTCLPVKSETETGTVIVVLTAPIELVGNETVTQFAGAVPACVIVKVCPPIMIVPTRSCGDELAATE